MTTGRHGCLALLHPRPLSFSRHVAGGPCRVKGDGEPGAAG